MGFEPLPDRRQFGAAKRDPLGVDCPHDCPCDAPKQRVQSQRQPTRSIREAENSEGFTRKIEVAQETGFRLANRRLRPLGHLTADAKYT